MPSHAFVGATHLFKPDVVLAPSEQVAPSLPLGSDGVQRWVWHSRYGAMLIEVVANEVFVDGDRVEPYAA